MSKQPPAREKPGRRQELLAEVAMSVGGFRTAADIVDEAVAATFAVNRTDLRLIQALQVRGEITAGELARAVGLSPAATTTAIDRLVAAGHATREHDERDRRRVIVALTPGAKKLAEEAFGVMVEAGGRMLGRYSSEQLRTIRDFMERARQVEADHADRLKAARSRRSRSPSSR